MNIREGRETYLRVNKEQGTIKEKKGICRISRVGQELWVCYYGAPMIRYGAQRAC